MLPCRNQARRFCFDSYYTANTGKSNRAICESVGGFVFLKEIKEKPPSQTPDGGKKGKEP